MIRTKRVYEPASTSDGPRFLVERLWPRGIKKEALRMEAWLKDAAPSPALRQWFSHDPAKWQEFQRRYLRELDANPQACQPLLEAARRGPVTLIYSARDPERNSAKILQTYLEKYVSARAVPSAKTKRASKRPRSR
jgi:uncharacterized protein YeaO (DUF488 family)